MPKQKSAKAKIIKRIILFSIAFLLLLCLSTYVLIRSYIKKLNIIASQEVLLSDIVVEPELEQQLESKQELETSDTPISTKEEIISIEDEIRRNIQEKSTPIMYDEDVLNILLIGNDSMESGAFGRSDAMIMISLNKATKIITATSLLRDIYLKIPGRSSNRMNAAYAYGGADLLMDTIEQNFNLQIDRYASIDFYAFMEIVDSVGGVTLEITSEEIPVINKYIKQINQLIGQEEKKDFITDTGIYLLNGKQALSYARNRNVGNADFERTARQRRVLKEIFNNVKNLGLIELNDLMNIILPKITTNLTEGELFSLILSLPTYADYDLEQWSIPVEDSYKFMNIRGMSVLGIDFQKNIDEIRKRIYSCNEE